MARLQGMSAMRSVGIIGAAVSLLVSADGAEILCEGTYQHHLQGVASDGDSALFWCFTSVLVKTDMAGKILCQIPVKSHHGDLTYHAGKVYVAVNFGSFNREPGRENSWVYVYDAADLAFVSKHAVPELVHGAGGMAYHNDRFIVIGGLPETHTVNYLYEYDETFTFLKRHVLPSGYTKLGIQTACYNQGIWWLGCYGNRILKANAAFKLTGSYGFDCSVGIVPLPDGNFLIGRSTSPKYGGKLIPAKADAEKGLEFIREE